MYFLFVLKKTPNLYHYHIFKGYIWKKKWHFKTTRFSKQSRNSPNSSMEAMETLLLLLLFFSSSFSPRCQSRFDPLLISIIHGEGFLAVLGSMALVHTRLRCSSHSLDDFLLAFRFQFRSGWCFRIDSQWKVCFFDSFKHLLCFLWFDFSVDDCVFWVGGFRVDGIGERGGQWMEVISWEPRIFIYHNLLVWAHLNLYH